ncbi:MAG: hypothetical protein HY910_17710 [Desulfarculus sp.]|nr:hypothetical protein [Desulfarculus sp.]
MSSNINKISEIRARAAHPNHMYAYCRVIGCGRPARAGTSTGLDTRYCRVHADHLSRHGSAYKGSYLAKVINPYRRAALDWLLVHGDLFWVKDAVGKVEGLYHGGGPHIEAFRLPGLKPRERGKAQWARLRHHEVDPRLVVAVWLAVEMVIGDDLQPVSTSQYKRVQAAKVVHRMASGTHKSWEQERPHPAHPGLPPIVHIQKLSWYPKSRGRVLRYIGEDLERAAELLVDHHLEEVREYKRERDSQGKPATRPYPKGIRARGRRMGT